MSRQIINIGTVPGDDTGDSLYDGGQKINDNFEELYAGAIDLNQVRTVSQGSFGFTSIQDAIDDIADADATKPYVVYIYPGIYDEQVTLTPYISLVGVDRDAVIVTHTGDINGTIIGAANCQVSNLTVRLSEVETEWGIVATDCDQFEVRRVTLGGAVEAGFTSNAVKFVGSAYRNVVDDSLIRIFGDTGTTLYGVHADVAAWTPDYDQQVMVRNSQIIVYNGDSVAVLMDGVRNGHIVGVGMDAGDIELVDCPFINIIATRAGALTVSAGSGITTYLRTDNARFSSLSTSGVGTIYRAGSYAITDAVDASAVPLYAPAGVALEVVSKTGTYAATMRDGVILGDATGGAFTVTLPTAVGRAGKTFTVKRINSGGNAVTVGTTSSQTIDGSTTYALSSQYASVTVVSDGANWHIIGKV